MPIVSPPNNQHDNCFPSRQPHSSTSPQLQTHTSNPMLLIVYHRPPTHQPRIIWSISRHSLLAIMAVNPIGHAYIRLGVVWLWRSIACKQLCYFSFYSHSFFSFFNGSIDPLEGQQISSRALY